MHSARKYNGNGCQPKGWHFVLSGYLVVGMAPITRGPREGWHCRLSLPYGCQEPDQALTFNILLAVL
jgi:hypothetical protein